MKIGHRFVTFASFLLAMSAAGLLGCSSGADASEVDQAESASQSLGESVASLIVTSDWTAGYCAAVTVQNRGSRPSTGWRVALSLPSATLNNAWNTSVTLTTGGLVAAPAGHNAVVPPGGKTEFGFCASRSSGVAPPSLLSASIEPGSDGGGGCSQSRKVVVVIDDRFQGPLQPELARWAADVSRADPVCVTMEPVNVTATSPEQIRARLKVLHANGLEGILLIGDIPTALRGDFAGDSPTDMFYEDLTDGHWLDKNHNGVYERTEDVDGDGAFDRILHARTFEAARELWAGRLTPPSDAPLDVRISALQRYFDRNHAYRSGAKVYSKEMTSLDSLRNNGDDIDGEAPRAELLAKAERVAADSLLFAREDLRFVWDADLETQMRRWLTAIAMPRELARIAVHGSENSQWFGGTHFLTTADYAAVPTNALLVELLSCSNASFTSSDYLGGGVLFDGSALAVRGNTTPVFYIDTDLSVLEAPASLRLLALGQTLGQTRLADATLSDADVLLGDPTLRLRAPGPGSVLEVPTELVFPESPRDALSDGQEEVQRIQLRNLGTAPINARVEVGDTSVDGLPSKVFLDSRFVASVAPGGVSVVPGASATLDVSFVFASTTQLGQYLARLVVTTDSPATPFVNVALRKRIR